MKRILIFVVCLIALTALAINYPSSSFFGTSVQNQTTAGGVCTAIGAVQTVNHGSEFAANGFPAGLTTIGSQNGMAAITDGSVLWNFDGSTTGHARAGDAGLYIATWSTNRYNSGSQVGLVVMGQDASGNATPLDVVGAALAYVPYGRNAGIIPQYCMWVMNTTTNNRGFAVCSTGIGPDAENYSIAMFDCDATAFRIPKFQQGLLQPRDKVYTFTVSGITSAPHFTDMYSNNGALFTLCNGNGSLSGSPLSGTITMTGQSDPAANGTLKLIGLGNTNLVPDASITFSTFAVTKTWQDTFYADPNTGKISLTNGYICPPVLYSNLNNASITVNNAGEYEATATLVFTNCSNATYKLPDPVLHGGETKRVKALGAGTLTVSTAAGTFGETTVTGFSFAATFAMQFAGRQVQFTSANGQWWVTGNAAN